MKTVLLSGGTGRLGRVLVPALIAKGYSLRLVTRDAAEARKLGFVAARNFRVIEADLSQEGSAQTVSMLASAVGQVDLE